MIGSLAMAILVMHAGLVAAGAGQSGQVPPSQAAAEKPWPPPGVVLPGHGVVSPRILKEAKPRYTAEAMKAEIQGTVMMEAVVEVDGSVGEVRVTRSLDREYGLDDAAVWTLKKWRFTPGTVDGVAVRVLVEVEMSFTRR